MGTSFIVASALSFAAVIVGEVLLHVAPFLRDRLDTADPLFMPEKLATLAVGAAVYVGATYAAYRKSARLFERQDL